MIRIGETRNVGSLSAIGFRSAAASRVVAQEIRWIQMRNRFREIEVDEHMQPSMTERRVELNVITAILTSRGFNNIHVLQYTRRGDGNVNVVFQDFNQLPTVDPEPSIQPRMDEAVAELEEEIRRPLLTVSTEGGWGLYVESASYSREQAENLCNAAELTVAQGDMNARQRRQRARRMLAHHTEANIINVFEEDLEGGRKKLKAGKDFYTIRVNECKALMLKTKRHYSASGPAICVESFPASGKRPFVIFRSTERKSENQFYIPLEGWTEQDLAMKDIPEERIATMIEPPKRKSRSGLL